MKELEMILAAVAQLGEAGKEAFIWWLVMEKGLGFITVIVVSATLLVGIRWGITACSYEKDLRYIRDTLQIGSSGYITRSEIDYIHRKITEMIKKN